MTEINTHSTAPEADLAPSKSSGVGVLPVAAALAGGLLVSGAIGKPAHAVTPALRFADITGTGDIKVLNYALALEVLETDLYVQAALRLQGGGTNALGKSIPGLGLPDNHPAVIYTKKFGKVELEHRNFLIGALGNQAITNGALRTAKFDFKFDVAGSNSLQQVVDLLLTAEATGVRAYLGAIVFLRSATYLQVAGAIQGTEARHTAVITQIRNRLFGSNQPVAPLANQNNGIDSPLDPDSVLAAVSPFIVL